MTAVAGDTFWITRNPVGRARDLLKSGRRFDAPRPPGPRGRPFIGVLPEFRADPFGYLQHLADVYGDIYRLPLPMYDVVVLNHPDYLGQVMNCRDGEYSMTGSASRLIRHVLGASVAMLEGDPFRQRRKLLTPMFSRRQLAKIAGTVADEFAHRLARWDRFAETGESIDLEHELAGVTMPAFMAAMFTTQLPDDELHQLDAANRTLIQHAASPIFLGPTPRLLPGPGNLAQAWLRIRRWVQQRVDERLADRNVYDDLMQMVLDARYPDGSPISRRDTVTELVMLITGGYETVVAALSWTFALLPQNPQAQQRLYDEVDGLGGTTPTYDDLDRLQWAKACFEEGQRLQGNTFLPRFAMIDDTIGGYRIRRGNLIGVSPYTMHRDRRWWSPDVNDFEPTRFYDKATVSARPNLAYLPFGAGPHRCLGAAMGYMDAQFLLAQIHQRFRIQMPSAWTPRHDAQFPWTIEGGVPAVLTKVTANQAK